jgi:hypothetical protein
MLKSKWFKYSTDVGLGFSAGTALVQGRWLVLAIGIFLFILGYFYLED